MELYLIEYNGKVIGAYDDYNLAKQFIDSCVQLKFMVGTSKILRYHKNSCLLINSEQNNIVEPIIELPRQKIVDNVETKNHKIVELEKNEDYIKISKEKTELLRNLNDLKIKKEKLEENKRIYENDLKLFNLFSENKKKDPNFIIPELFNEKYIIFLKLSEENNLSWNTFQNEYDCIKGVNNYDDLFVSNKYEEKFTKQKIEDINEEYDIETDSDTESEN
jgi:hypothetical protein